MGILYVTATPIGNLEDMTVRALRTLQQVRVIAAEDTRHSLKLLNHFGLSARLVSYHDHNKDAMTATLLGLLDRDDVALITDAGTPCISDPGYEIVSAAHAAGIEVQLIPGADAITTLIASAPGDGPFRPVRFVGFLPRKESAMRALFESWRAGHERIVFYESPNRLEKTLALLRTCLGEREVVIGVELTKFFEEITRATVTNALAYYGRAPIRGEVSVMIQPPL